MHWHGVRHIKAAIKAWYLEVVYFDSRGIRSHKRTHGQGGPLETGHYTTMVWADTEQIGCGQAYYKRNEGRRVPYKTFIVCNYATGGNIIGQEIYKTGPACSSCPQGYGCQKSLCVKN